MKKIEIYTDFRLIADKIVETADLIKEDILSDAEIANLVTHLASKWSVS